MLRVGLSCKRSAFIPPLACPYPAMHNKLLFQNAITILT
jgi:hypothetical protein